MNGLFTALITPFHDDKICYTSLEKLINWQLKNDVNNLVIAGTTGESTLLTHKEKSDLLRFTRTVAPDCNLIAGVSSPSTAEAVKQAVIAETLGADALLVSPPYYSKCTHDGYVFHIESIASAVSLPIILYNVPARSGYCISQQQLQRCMELPNVNHVKQCVEIDVARRLYINGMQMLCGDDGRLIEYADSGICSGAVSVMSNLFPHETAQAMTGKSTDVYRKSVQLLSRDINPVVIKYMLYCAGLIKSPDVRLPLTLPNNQLRLDIKNFIDEVNI